MANKQKILDLLMDTYGDDPQVAILVSKELRKEYETRVKALEEAHKQALIAVTGNADKQIKEMSRLHNKAYKESQKSFADHVAKLAKSHKEELLGVKKNSVDQLAELKKWVDETYGTRLEKYGDRIDKFEGSVGAAPNRSVYFNGNLASPYYTDINFIAGSGVTLSPSTNQVTQHADVIISSSGSTTVYNDAVSGVINGVNRVYTVPNTIAFPIFLSLGNSNYQSGVDYTVTGPAQITFTTAPDSSLAGQPFWLSHT